MPKDILVLSNGTGQEGAKAAAMNSNVHRLFNMMENRTSSASFLQKHSGNGADVKMRRCTWSQPNTRPLVRLEVQSNLLQSTWI